MYFHIIEAQRTNYWIRL